MDELTTKQKHSPHFPALVKHSYQNQGTDTYNKPTLSNFEKNHVLTCAWHVSMWLECMIDLTSFTSSSDYLPRN